MAITGIEAPIDIQRRIAGEADYRGVPGARGFGLCACWGGACALSPLQRVPEAQ